MNVVSIFKPIGVAAGEMSAEHFMTEVANTDGGDIELHINSPGGSVIEGIAIGSVIENFSGKVTAVVQGGALSIASYIVAKCDYVVMAKDAWLMIHNPMTALQGDSVQFRKTADQMDNFGKQLVEAYATRSGLGADDITKMMDEETWINADDAIEMGFANAIAESENKLSSLDVRAFTNVPQVVAKSKFSTPPKKEEPMPATIAEIKSSCVGASADFILAQIEASAELPSVQTAWSSFMAKAKAELEKEVEALTAKNAELTAKIEAMEEAPAEEEEEEAKAEEPAEEEEEEEVPAAKAKARAKAVAKPSGRKVVSAREEWHTQLTAAHALPHVTSAADAIKYVNRTHKGLRQRMLDEANA